MSSTFMINNFIDLLKVSQSDFTSLQTDTNEKLIAELFEYHKQRPKKLEKIRRKLSIQNILMFIFLLVSTLFTKFILSVDLMIYISIITLIGILSIQLFLYKRKFVRLWMVYLFLHFIIFAFLISLAILIVLIYEKLDLGITLEKKEIIFSKILVFFNLIAYMLYFTLGFFMNFIGLIILQIIIFAKIFYFISYFSPINIVMDIAISFIIALIGLKEKNNNTYIKKSKYILRIFINDILNLYDQTLKSLGVFHVIFKNDKIAYTNFNKNSFEEMQKSSHLSKSRDLNKIHDLTGNYHNKSRKDSSKVNSPEKKLSNNIRINNENKFSSKKLYKEKNYEINSNNRNDKNNLLTNMIKSGNEVLIKNHRSSNNNKNINHNPKTKSPDLNEIENRFDEELLKENNEMLKSKKPNEKDLRTNEFEYINNNINQNDILRKIKTKNSNNSKNQVSRNDKNEDRFSPEGDRKLSNNNEKSNSKINHINSPNTRRHTISKDEYLEMKNKINIDNLNAIDEMAKSYSRKENNIDEKNASKTITKLESLNENKGKERRNSKFFQGGQIIDDNNKNENNQIQNINYDRIQNLQHMIKLKNEYIEYNTKQSKITNKKESKKIQKKETMNSINNFLQHKSSLKTVNEITKHSNKNIKKSDMGNRNIDQSSNNKNSFTNSIVQPLFTNNKQSNSIKRKVSSENKRFEIHKFLNNLIYSDINKNEKISSKEVNGHNKKNNSNKQINSRNNCKNNLWMNIINFISNSQTNDWIRSKTKRVNDEETENLNNKITKKEFEYFGIYQYLYNTTLKNNNKDRARFVEFNRLYHYEVCFRNLQNSNQKKKNKSYYEKYKYSEIFIKEVNVGVNSADVAKCIYTSPYQGELSNSRDKIDIGVDIRSSNSISIQIEKFSNYEKVEDHRNTRNPENKKSYDDNDQNRIKSNKDHSGKHPYNNDEKEKNLINSKNKNLQNLELIRNKFFIEYLYEIRYPIKGIINLVQSITRLIQSAKEVKPQNQIQNIQSFKDSEENNLKDKDSNRMQVAQPEKKAGPYNVIMKEVKKLPEIFFQIDNKELNEIKTKLALLNSLQLDFVMSINQIIGFSSDFLFEDSGSNETLDNNNNYNNLRANDLQNNINSNNNPYQKYNNYNSSSSSSNNNNFVFKNNLKNSKNVIINNNINTNINQTNNNNGKNATQLLNKQITEYHPINNTSNNFKTNNIYNINENNNFNVQKNKDIIVNDKTTAYDFLKNVYSNSIQGNNNHINSKGLSMNYFSKIKDDINFFRFVNLEDELIRIIYDFSTNSFVISDINLYDIIKSSYEIIKSINLNVPNTNSSSKTNSDSIDSGFFPKLSLSEKVKSFTIKSNDILFRIMIFSIINHCMKSIKSGIIILGVDIVYSKSKIMVYITTNDKKRTNSENSCLALGQINSIPVTPQRHSNFNENHPSLFVSKLIAEKLNHNIIFESEFGKGDSFIIEVNYEDNVYLIEKSEIENSDINNMSRIAGEYGYYQGDNKNPNLTNTFTNNSIFNSTVVNLNVNHENSINLFGVNNFNGGTSPIDYNNNQNTSNHNINSRNKSIHRNSIFNNSNNKSTNENRNNKHSAVIEFEIEEDSDSDKDRFEDTYTNKKNKVVPNTNNNKIASGDRNIQSNFISDQHSNNRRFSVNVYNNRNYLTFKKGLEEVSGRNIGNMQNTPNFLSNPNNNVLSPRGRRNSNQISTCISQNKSTRSVFPLSTKVKILIVDDNRYNRKIMRNIIIEANKNIGKNFDIVEGRDGLDILNFVIEDNKNFNSIKCIFTDEVMDYIDGSRTIELLKNMENNNKIKKIFTISVLNAEEELHKETIISRGADFIVNRPLIITDFEKILDKVFSN